MVAILPVLFSPVRRIREVPAQVDDAIAERDGPG
jgi:hypothetical protein